MKQLDKKIKLEALITEREMMIWENKECEYSNVGLTFGLVDFRNVMNSINELIESNKCKCCGNNLAVVCDSCVSEIAQETGNQAYNSRR